MSVDWNPARTSPRHVRAPHFDFHFYLIDAETRDAILPGDPPDLVAFEGRGSRAPGGNAAGPLRLPGRATVPKMGGHWIDPAAHEFHGATFDTTFIYGTWDGEVIFWEPMVTKAHIESRPDATIEIATPARAAKAAGTRPGTGWGSTPTRRSTGSPSSDSGRSSAKPPPTRRIR